MHCNKNKLFRAQNERQTLNELRTICKYNLRVVSYAEIFVFIPNRMSCNLELIEMDEMPNIVKSNDEDRVRFSKF